MVRDGRYKLVIWHDVDEYRLFDLENDPREEHNLAKMPEYKNRCQGMLDRIRDYYSRYSLPDKSGTRPEGPEATNMTSPWNCES
jgi:arylsulfatase A-like enzyme